MRQAWGVVLSTGLMLLAGCQGGAPTEQADEQGDLRQSASSNQTIVYRSTWNGGGAHLAWAEGMSSLFLDVNESGSGANHSVFLNFGKSWTDPSSMSCRTERQCWWPKGSPVEVCEDVEICEYTRWGYEYFGGQLPAGDFAVSKALAHLSTDLVNATNYWGESCSFDSMTGYYQCVPFTPKGTLNLSWKRNGIFSSRGTGTYDQKVGKYLYRSTGSWGYASAAVVGTAFDLAINSGDGQLSQSMGNSVQRSIVVDP